MITSKQITEREEAAWKAWESRNTKRVVVYAIETYNDPYYGWECEGLHATWASAKAEKKEYLDNAECPVRIRVRRLKREEVFKTDPES